MPQNSACALCPLSGGAQTVCLWGRGPTPCEIMVVGQNPGRDEDRTGRPFVGEAGKLLTRLLEKSGFDREHIYISNAVKCVTPDNREPEPSEAAECKVYLAEEIQTVNPKVIVALGNTALRALTGRSGITQYRGKVQPLHNIFAHTAQVMPTFHTAYALRQMSAERHIVEDLGAAKRLLTNEYACVSTPWVYASDRFDVSGPLSFDLETNGLDWTAPGFKIYMCGINDGHTTTVFVGDAVANAVHILNEAQNHFEIVGHNASDFDRAVLLHHHGVDIKCMDTMLEDYLLDEERHSRTLESLATSHLGVAPWKTIDWEKVNAGEVPQDEVAEYLSRDCHYTHLLHQKFYGEIQKDPPLDRFYRHLFLPTARALHKISKRGVYTDDGAIKAARLELEGVVDDTRRRLVQLSSSFGISDFNPNSHPQVRQLLYDRLRLPVYNWTDKGGEPSTDYETLLLLQDRHEGVQWLLDYRENKKLLDYALAYADLRDERGRVYPRYSVWSTDTGRTSARDPNIQNVPRDNRLRRIIAAPPGRKLVIGDYSQCQLRIVAHLANEKNMIEAYRRGDDIHRLMAARVYQKEPAEITYDERVNGKISNLLLVFGGEGYTLKRQALTDYGVVISDQEANTRWESFHTLWPDFGAWYIKIFEECTRDGFVRSMFGVKRRLPNIRSARAEIKTAALRQAINAPVQHAEFGMMAIALCLLEEGGHEVVAEIHDSLMVECDQDKADAVATRMKTIMEDEVPRVMREHFAIDFSVPLVADVHIGQSWG